MTRNKSTKQAIRNHMSQTGESYCVAWRALEKLHGEAEPQVTVYELGEDGDSWFIEGAASIDAAKHALNEWLYEIYDEHDHALLEEILLLVSEASWTHREDWFWVPFLASHPNDEQVLKSKSQNPNEYKGEELCPGIHLTI